MKNKPKFNDTFIEFIRKNVFVVANNGVVDVSPTFKDKIDTFREDGKKSKVMVLGKDGTWLSKELNKWKNKIYPRETCSFKGTIQNLEYLCELTKSTPNNLLLSSNDLIEFCGDEVTYITEETILEIADNIMKNENNFNDELILPIKSRPQSMVTLFIKFYRSSGCYKDIQAIYLVSEYSESDGIIAYPDEREDKIVNLSDPNKSRLSLKDMIKIANEEYQLSCRSFKEECENKFGIAKEYASKKETDILLQMISNEINDVDMNDLSINDMIDTAKAQKTDERK